MGSALNTGAEGAVVTWAGHATMLVQTSGVRLLTDPVLGGRVGLLRRLASPVPSSLAEDIDVVLLSHAHADHLDLPSLRRIGTGVPVLAPPAAARVLRRRGFGLVREVESGSIVRVGTATVEATPAIHDGRRWPFGGSAEAVGFLIHGDPAVYFAGDTDLFSEMSRLAGRVDVALLPVWGWGPSIGPGHLDPERAAEAVAAIRPHTAIPIHWGTLARPGPRPASAVLARPARLFSEAVARRAPGVDVRVLVPGERTTFEHQTTAGRR